MIQRVRGTEDILDTSLLNFIIDTAKKHFTCYNFHEIQTPILEHMSLFQRTLGKETDVVTKEMYTFETNSGESICLRPEATASTMRAFLEGTPKATPWKVFSYGPMFRHERPQKGRMRQFSQFNMEVIGSNSIFEDAHFLKMLDVYFSQVLPLENYVLKVNFLGTREDRALYKDTLKNFLDGISSQMCETCNVRREKNILRVFDCKNETCAALLKDAPKLSSNLSEASAAEWEQLKEALQMLSVNFVHDDSLVRGLDYYNQTVFEFSSRDLGAQNAFCGGGRWELARELGGKEDVPSIGAAIGITRLLLLLEAMGEKVQIPHKPRLNVIIPMTKEQQVLALLLAYDLQAHNVCADIIFDCSSMKNMMRTANKMGAANVLILGEDEQKSGTVVIKNMQTGAEQKVKQVEARSLLA
jgi:histidyl-tRNA synthetase